MLEGRVGDRTIGGDAALARVLAVLRGRTARYVHCYLVASKSPPEAAAAHTPVMLDCAEQVDLRIFDFYLVIVSCVSAAVLRRCERVVIVVSLRGVCGAGHGE